MKSYAAVRSLRGRDGRHFEVGQDIFQEGNFNMYQKLEFFEKERVMLLRSVSFNTECSSKIWELFEKANELGTKLDYTLEIIEAAMQGRIDFEKDFKLKEYVASIDRTKRLEGLREAKRAVHVTDVSDDEDSSGVPYPVDDRDDYEELENKFELQQAVDRFNEMQNYFLVNAKCDSKLAVRQALRGIPESIELVKNLCDEYPIAADLLKIILGSGYSYEQIFPE